MRKPTAGVMAPNTATRIEFDPPIAAEESPLLLTPPRQGTGWVHMRIQPSVITLHNGTDKHVPFVLVVVPQNPDLSSIFSFIKQRLTGA